MLKQTIFIGVDIRGGLACPPLMSTPRKSFKINPGRINRTQCFEGYGRKKMVKWQPCTFSVVRVAACSFAVTFAFALGVI